MFRLRTIVILAALTAALVMPSAVQARSGSTGWYAGVQVTCMGNRILVTGPSMEPAYNMLLVNGALTVNVPQQVAYRAHVAKLVNGTWVRVASDRWIVGWVSTDGSGALPSTGFTVRQAGRYKVYAEYYWYAHQHFNYSGYDIQWAPFTADFNAGGYMGWGDPHCG